jgi:hypothetical protein
MNLSQTWVGYLDRSYEQIKRSVLRRLGVQAPEITDHSESNPLIVLVSLFSGIAEVIHLYLDSIAREAFIGTARKYASVVKLARLIDYSPKARASATVDLLFTLVDSNGDPLAAANDIVIPVGTLIYPLNSTIPFRTLNEATIPTGYTSKYIPASQFNQVTGEILGTTDGAGALSQLFPLSSKYVHATLEVEINGEAWVLYNSFGLMSSTTKGAVVQIDEEGDAFLVFGDGVNGAVPPNGQDIFVNYKESEGITGNLPPGSITELQSTLSLPTGYELEITNPDYSSGGTDFESIEVIRNLAPRSLRTLLRAVTYQDYIDVSLQVPGVGAAEVKYCCGKYIDVFIAPNSQGTATSALVAQVQNYLDCRKMITTQVAVKPAGVTRVWIKATVIGKPLIPEAEIKAQVYNALDEEFGIGNIEINRNVSITDIISIVEQLSKVDTIEISEVRVEPYARPQDGTVNPLDITFSTLPHSTTRIPYAIVYKAGTDDFEIYKNGLFVQTLAWGATYNDAGIIAFEMPVGPTYTDNDKWELIVFPSYAEIFPSTIITIDDYSAPIVEVSAFIDDVTPRTIFGNFTFTEQGSSVSCLPNC